MPIPSNNSFFSAFILSILICLCCTSASAEDDGWDLRYSQDGLNVYTKYIKGAQVKSFRAEMVADAPMDLVLSVIKDVHHYPNWFHLCKSYEILQGSMNQGEYIGYYIVEAPWPLKDRDVYVKNVMQKDPDTQTVTILTNAVPDFEPVKDGLTRVPEVYGRWTFRPVSPDKTYIEFIGHGRPGGIIPVWIANMVVTDVPKKTFLNLRSLLADKETRQEYLLSGKTASNNGS